MKPEHELTLANNLSATNTTTPNTQVIFVLSFLFFLPFFDDSRVGALYRRIARNVKPRDPLTFENLRRLKPFHVYLFEIFQPKRSSCVVCICYGLNVCSKLLIRPIL